MAERYRAADLMAFAAGLFRAAGLDEEKARVTAELLVEADLMGHTTHGLALGPAYLGCLADGRMARAGEPDVVAEGPAVLTLDGKYLPGLWLTANGVDAVSFPIEFEVAPGIEGLVHISQLSADKRVNHPRDVVEMVAVGEESNNLAQVLLNIAEALEKRTSRQLELFVRLLEPMMLLVMAGVTLLVVAGLLLPVFKMGAAAR